MSQELKLRVYNTIIILTVLHAHESGALRKKHNCQIITLKMKQNKKEDEVRRV